MPTIRGREEFRRWSSYPTFEEISARPETTDEVRPRIETNDEVSIGFNPNNSTAYPDYRRSWRTFPSERMSLDPEPICAADFESDFDDWYKKEIEDLKTKRKSDFKNDMNNERAEDIQLLEWETFKNNQIKNNKCWGFLE